MKHRVTVAFWCRTCGERLDVGSRHNADKTQEAVFYHARTVNDTHAPSPSFTPPLPASQHRNSR